MLSRPSYDEESESEEIEMLKETEQEQVMRTALVPPSVAYLRDVIPKAAETKIPDASIEYILPKRITDFSQSPPRSLSPNNSLLRTAHVDYIPSDLALSFIRRMEGDMRDMDSRYRKLLREMDAAYEEMEKEAIAKWVEFAERMKGEKERQEKKSRELVNSLRREFEEYKGTMGKQVDDYRRKLKELRIEKNDLSQRLVSELETHNSAHTTQLAEERAQYQELLHSVEETARIDHQRLESSYSQEISQLKALLHSQQTENAELRNLMLRVAEERQAHSNCEWDIAELIVKAATVDIELQEAASRPELRVGAILKQLHFLQQSLGDAGNKELQQVEILAEMGKLQEEAATLGFPLESAAVFTLKQQLEESQNQLTVAGSEIQRLKEAMISGSDDSVKRVYEEVIAKNERIIGDLTAELSRLKSLFLTGSDCEDPVLAAVKRQLAAKTQESEEKSQVIVRLQAQVQSLEEELLKRQGPRAEDLDSIAKLQQDLSQQREVHKSAVRKLEKALKRESEDHRKALESSGEAVSSLQAQLLAVQSQLQTDAESHSRLQADLDQLAALKSEHQRLCAQIEALQRTNLQKEVELKESVKQRKVLHNQLQDMKGKIRVYCRARPMSDSEVAKNTTNVVTIPDEFTVNCEMKTGQVKTFQYDSVFGPASTQEEVFEETKGLVQSAVDGYNVCIFAYGQTGSGKTFTMQGPKSNPGITPRSFAELFSILSSLPRHYRYQVSCYMVELYLDTLIDLLLPSSPQAQSSLTIQKNIDGTVEIPEVTTLPINSAIELLQRFEQGEAMRHTSSTKMNDTSSRSHLVFTVIVDVENCETRVRTVGKLNLVDLAGSERVSKTESTADRLREGRAINKSLTALGDVIAALSGNESHIPYRNNKLTLLMSDSLGGSVLSTQAKTLMFVNVSPSSYNREETSMSLFYASRVKLITNDIRKNVESRETTKLKDELMRVMVERDRYKQALLSANLPTERVTALLSQPLRAAVCTDFDSSSNDD